MKNRPLIASYYFPNWHVDPRNEKLHGTGWTEWNVTRCALPRFPGHVQPKTPIWGYEDESVPTVMERKIAVNAFLFRCQGKHNLRPGVKSDVPDDACGDFRCNMQGACGFLPCDFVTGQTSRQRNVCFPEPCGGDGMVCTDGAHDTVPAWRFSLAQIEETPKRSTEFMTAILRPESQYRSMSDPASEVRFS